MKNISLLNSILLFVFLNVTCSNLCENTILNEIESPSKKYMAYAFIRDCGATTSFSPQVTINEKTFWGKYPDIKNQTGNVFIGYKSRDIEIQWGNDNTLIIRHNCNDTNVFKNEKKMKDVTVIYEKITNIHKSNN